jgi:predicted PhzF superfamily epimerase YddE/YHI9
LNGPRFAFQQVDVFSALPLYVVSQGICVGRDGRVEVRFGDDETIWLGGHAVTCVEGTLRV